MSETLPAGPAVLGLELSPDARVSDDGWLERELHAPAGLDGPPGILQGGLAAGVTAPIARLADRHHAPLTSIDARLHAPTPLGASLRARVRASDAAARYHVETRHGDDRGERLDAGYRIDDGVAEIRLHSEQRGPSFDVRGSDRVWDLELTRSVPIGLAIDTGVGESVLELREIALSDFDLDAGVGSVRVTLPDDGGYRGDIDAGVGEVVVRIPRSVEARLEVDTGLGGVDVRGTWIRDGDVHESEGWRDAAAEDRVEMRVSGGVGEITVERID
ncbi:MAG: hypothetical protein ACOCT8_00855 [Actinomycetota bacterium]